MQGPQTRRIQLSGGSTYMVSLPKNWIEEMDIRIGQDITITRNQDRSLTLFPEGEIDAKKTTAIIASSQKDSGSTIKRKVISAYLAGYKTIKIKASGVRIPAGHTRGIRELVRSTMVGTEIVESSSEMMTIQILARLPELSFKTALERMYLMADNMVQEAIESIEMDAMHADQVVGMDDEVDRFGLYMRRNLVLAVQDQAVLKDMGLKKASDCLGYRAIVTRIERVADHAVLIAKRTRFIKGVIAPGVLAQIRQLTADTRDVFREAVTAVQEHDFERGEEAAQKAGGVIDQEKQVMGKIRETKKNATIIRFVLEDLRRIAEYSTDIAEVAIDENIQGIISEE